ncbi:MAG: DHH family phosphoesterase [Candidatus Njordarchaeales archaeon]
MVNDKTSAEVEDPQQFLDLLLKSKKILILPHEQTDIDAYAAAWLLRDFLRKKGIEAYLFLERPSLELRYFVESLNLEEPKSDVVGTINVGKNHDYDVLLVDIFDPNRFISNNARDVIKRAQRIFAIDHHQGLLPTDLDIIVYRKQYPSTCEVVLELLNTDPTLDEILANSEKLANALIGGILSDSRFLYNAIPLTFSILSKLAERGNFKLVYAVLRGRPQDYPERIARLKAAQRMQIMRLGDLLIAISKVGSYESSAANALISLGADIALVISKKKDNEITRIVGRGRKKIDLAMIFSKIAKELGAMGGGHQNAATLQFPTSKIEEEKVLKRIITELIKSYLRD